MNLVELFDAHGIPHRAHGEHHHTSNGWISTDCNSCSPGSGKFRLGWNPHTGAVSCYNCGVQNRVIAFAELSGLARTKCWELLGGLDFKAHKDVKVTGKLVLPRGLGPLLSCHQKYLKGRGFDPEELEHLWGLKGIGLASRLAWRIFIPITWRGETVSWTTRSLREGVKAKYGNARPEEEKVSAKSVLFGGGYVRHAAIIVEGPLDAMRIGPGAVATMGLVVTKAQMNWLSKIPRRVVLFDSEPKAQRRAHRLADNLAAFDGETLVATISAADPGSASKKEIKAIRKLLA